MNPVETMGEYLVKLSADIDTNSFNAAMAALNQLMNALKNIKGLAAAAAAVTGFAAIGKAAIDTIKSVAAADMQFKRLANQMWITKDSAKALSTAMKVMGVSEEDLAWIPELREQFFRLRSEMNQLATPIDADRQLKWIREIGYDIQSLQVKLKMLKEWVTYYLIKYLQPFIKEFQQFIQWLNDKLGKNMPQIAKKIAEFLGHVVSVGLSALKVLKSVIGTVYRFIDGLPANVKKWGAIFATVGAVIMAGPFGKFLIAIGGALLLLEDFVYYMNGWKSSKTLAPVWEKLLDFLEGDSLANVTKGVKEFLNWVADKLDDAFSKFVKGFDWSEAKRSLMKGLHDLKGGVDALFDSVSDLFDKINKSTDAKHKNQQRSFWESLGKYVSDSVKALGDLAGDLGKIFRAVACALSGDFKGAASLLMQVATSAGSHFLSGIGKSIRFSGGDPGGDSDERTSKAMEYFQKSYGMTRAGASGLSGNLLSESGMDPLSVEGKEGVDPDDYRRRLLGGEMSEDEFMNDGVGFGIAQWTYPTRKRGLWEYAQSQGKSVADFGVQLEYLMKEIQADEYKDLYAYLQEAEDSDEASDQVMARFERPEVQDEKQMADRRQRSSRAYGLGSSFAGRSSFISPNSFAFSPNSYAATAGAGSNGFVQTGYSGGSSISFGDIHVNVTNSNASAKDIGNAVADAISTRYQRGVLV